MRSLRNVLAAIVGLMLPIGLALAVYLASAGAIAATPEPLQISAERIAQPSSRREREAEEPDEEGAERSAADASGGSRRGDDHRGRSWRRDRARRRQRRHEDRERRQLRLRLLEQRLRHDDSGSTRARAAAGTTDPAAS